MVNKKLLFKELEEQTTEMRPIRYNKDLFIELFKEYNYFGMTEYSYCCYGLEKHCWVEVIEEGVWGLTLDKVKKDIESSVCRAKKYLYNGKRYGSNRLWIGEEDGIIHVYIYLRDILEEDYWIWFTKR